RLVRGRRGRDRRAPRSQRRRQVDDARRAGDAASFRCGAGRRGRPRPPGRRRPRAPRARPRPAAGGGLPHARRAREPALLRARARARGAGSRAERGGGARPGGPRRARRRAGGAALGRHAPAPEPRLRHPPPARGPAPRRAGRGRRSAVARAHLRGDRDARARRRGRPPDGARPPEPRRCVLRAHRPRAPRRGHAGRLMLTGLLAALGKDLRLLARDRVGLVFLTLAPIVVISVAGLSLATLYGAEPGGGTAPVLPLADEDGGWVGRAVRERLADEPSIRVRPVATAAAAGAVV